MTKTHETPTIKKVQAKNIKGQKLAIEWDGVSKNHYRNKEFKAVNAVLFKQIPVDARKNILTFL